MVAARSDLTLAGKKLKITQTPCRLSLIELRKTQDFACLSLSQLKKTQNNSNGDRLSYFDSFGVEINSN